MATLGRTRQLSSGEYEISYDLTPVDGVYEGELQLLFDFAAEHTLTEVAVRDTDCGALTVNVESTDQASCSLTVSIDTAQADDTTRTSLTIVAETDTGHKTTETISIPLSFPLTRLREIVTGEFSADSVTVIHTRYDKTRPVWSLFSFQRDCRYLLSFDTLLAVMNTLAGYNQQYRDELASNCDAFFKNMLLHEKSYCINSEAEFERRMEVYNSQENLSTIDRNEVEELYLHEWSENPRAFPTDPEMFGLSRHAITTVVTRSSFLEDAVAHVLAEDDAEIQRRIAPDEASYSNNRYTNLKEAAQNGPAVKRAGQWEELLPEAAVRSASEFKFVLGNFLYWQSLHRHDLDIELEIDLLRAAAKLFYYLNLPILRQRANCYQHLKLAHQHRFAEEYTQALIEAEHARSIAENKDGSWEVTLPKMAARACRDYALLQRNILLTDSEVDGAVTTVAQATRTISNMDVPERFQTALLHHLAANRHDTLAIKAENQEELLAAKSHLEQAFYHFDQCNRSKRKAYINYKLEELIDQIQSSDVEDAFRERARREAAPGEEEDARDPEFREKILHAYNGACAFCGARRETPDGRFEAHAAHIRPVSDNGPDLVQNGVSLCRLHHWAFDNGWVTLTDELTLEVADRPDAAGYEEFASLDGREMRMPDAEYKVPGTDFITYHRRKHGFETAATDDVEPDEISEEELADSTSDDIDETTDQNIETYLDRSSAIFSESDVRGSMNELAANRSL